MTTLPLKKSIMYKHVTVTQTTRMRMCIEQRQRACTRGMTL
jgi:hypothetical protein